MKKLAFAAALLVAAATTSAHAENYPTHTVTIIVPFAPGGPADVTGRVLADILSRHLGQSFVVENVGGAGGTVGSLRAARARPDGYTLISGHMGTHAAAPMFYPNLGYDPEKDFEPIGLIAEQPELLTVRKDFPANNLKEFVAYLRANPGKVNMGHPGVGTGPHLLAYQLAKFADSRMNFIPYRGAAPAMVDLIAGQIDLMVDQVQTSSAHVKGGTIKALAIAAPKRSATVPDVPTVDEAGAPGLYYSLWYGLWAPGNTPAPIVKKLQTAVQDALADPEVRARLTGLGMDIPTREQQTPEALVAQQKADIATWWPVIKAAGIKMQ